MTQYLALDYKETTVAVYGIDGATVSQIGGDFHRETDLPEGNYHSGMNRVCQIYGRTFAQHCSTTSSPHRIYQFDGTAYKVSIGSIGGSFLTFVAGTAWASPGASGTFIESGVTGDTHVLLNIASGTIASGAVITSGLGSGVAFQATTTEAAAQGGARNELGEWKAVFTSSFNGSPGSYCGLHSMIVSDKMGIGSFFQQASSTNIYGINYDVETDVWTQSPGVIGNYTNSNFDKWGASTVINDTIYMTAVTDIGNQYFMTMAYNPTTEAWGKQYGLNVLHTSSILGNGCYHVCEWKGRIFSATTWNNPGDGALIELSGAGWYHVQLCYINGITNTGWPYFETQTYFGAQLVENGGKLWVFIPGRKWNQGTVGWFVLAFTEKSGTITCDNMRSHTIAPSASQFGLEERLSASLLPLSGMSVYYGAGLVIGARLTVMRDQTGNAPSGQDEILMYGIPDANGGPAQVLKWGNPFTNLTFQINWSITPVLVDASYRRYTLTVASGDPTTELSNSGNAPHDWIGLTSDGRIFCVDGDNVTSSTVDVFYYAKTTPDWPTVASGACRKLVTPIPVIGTTGGVAALALPDEQIGGGGREFRKDDKSGIITGATPDTNRELISMKFSGGGTVTASLYHSLASGGFVSTQSTISLPVTVPAQVWSVNGKDMDNVPANGTEILVYHETVTDSISDGDVIKRCIGIAS